MRPSKIKINVSKILKDQMFKGQKGTYLDCVIWPNKNGPGERGDTHYIQQDVSKEARERGEKGPIIGNLTWVEPEERSAPRSAPRSEPRSAPPRPSGDTTDKHPDDVPF